MMHSISNENKGWRYKLGLVLFITPFPIFIATPFVIPLLGLSAAETGALIGGIFLIVEVVWFASIPLLGKQGFLALKNKAFGWLKLHEGPISYRRHKLGVWLLAGSILVEMILQIITLLALSIPTDNERAATMITGVPYGEFNMVYLGIELLTTAGIIISVFLLGADFWEKLKNAFEWQG